MAAEGARLIVNGRRGGFAEEVAREIRAEGGSALAVPADVTVAAQVDLMVRSVLDAFGRVDILVNNAGGLAGVRPTEHLEEVLEDEWDRVVDLNFKAAGGYCPGGGLPRFRRGPVHQWRNTSMAQPLTSTVAALYRNISMSALIGDPFGTRPIHRQTGR